MEIKAIISTGSYLPHIVTQLEYNHLDSKLIENKQKLKGNEDKQCTCFTFWLLNVTEKLQLCWL